MNNNGYIYCFSNPIYKKNIYKICYSKTNLISDKNFVNDFTIEFYKKVDDYDLTIKKIKEFFEYFSISSANLYKINIHNIKVIFDSFSGSYCDNIITNIEITDDIESIIQITEPTETTKLIDYDLKNNIENLENIIKENNYTINNEENKKIWCCFL